MSGYIIFVVNPEAEEYKYPPEKLGYTGLVMRLARIEKISRALADTTRLMIFQAISARRQMNCREIARLRGVTPATVSHHLKILADAGLIECRRNGQFIYNRVIGRTLAEYSRALTRIVRGKKARKASS